MRMKKESGRFLSGMVRGFLAAVLCAVGLAAFADLPAGFKAQGVSVKVTAKK